MLGDVRRFSRLNSCIISALVSEKVRKFKSDAPDHTEFRAGLFRAHFLQLFTYTFFNLEKHEHIKMFTMIQVMPND